MSDQLDQARRMAAHLLAAAEIDFDQSDKLTQALIGTFLFGMLSAQAMTAGRAVDEAYNVAIDVFEDVLHYTPEAAREGVQQCIEATTPGVHPSMHAIVHRGIDGHLQYTSNDINGLRLNIKSIFEHFQR
jgi:hypothetical protein